MYAITMDAYCRYKQNAQQVKDILGLNGKLWWNIKITLEINFICIVLNNMYNVPDSIHNKDNSSKITWKVV